MLPMLRQNQDLVVIEPPKRHIRRYDVVLYKRGSKYVLHRVIGMREHCCLIRGDNTYYAENDVMDSDVLGVLTSFVRNGKRHDVTDWGYWCYVRFWCATFPLRFLCIRLLRKMKRIIQRRCP